jgi:hypothetical protein
MRQTLLEPFAQAGRDKTNAAPAASKTERRWG